MQQLIDEGLPLISNIDTNIDKQLADYFTSAIADGSFISWVMENDGEIIATSGLCFYLLPPNFLYTTGRTAYITNMYTKPEHRRKGIATELLNMVIEEAKSSGYRVVRLHTSEYGKSIYEPLLDAFRKHEFCWKPSIPVPVSEYTNVYKSVYEQFVQTKIKHLDYMIFDGSMLTVPSKLFTVNT